MSSNEASTNTPRRNIVLLNVVFGLVMFASAYLLFQVQPLISKAILPWFGGTPAVWNTCLLFFQITLFGGYLYAHFVSTKLAPKTQLIAHGVLLLLACIVLPIRPNPDWKPDGTGSPILEIVLILTASVGLPFFVLSTTAPLLQHWFSKSLSGRSPYHLYALSNVGSLLGLLCYPFVVEPALTLGQQSVLFSFAFVLCSTGCACCALSAFRSSQGGKKTKIQQKTVEHDTRVQSVKPERQTT